MENPFGVRGFQSVGKLDCGVEKFVWFKRAARQPLFQSLSLQQLHHDERLLFAFVDVVDRADVRMIQSRDGLCLPAKPLERPHVADKVIGKELHRHESFQASVRRLVDHSHAASTDSIKDAIVRNGFTDHAVGGDYSPDSSSANADLLAVGAVYDRAVFAVEWDERAVIDRAYSRKWAANFLLCKATAITQ